MHHESTHTTTSNGAASLLVAAVTVALVSDVADRDVPEQAVIRADEYEAFGVQESAQPVPSTGLIDNPKE